jgi:hypothetical protein
MSLQPEGSSRTPIESLQVYLEKGERSVGYRDAKRFVSTDRLRLHLLACGFTELALTIRRGMNTDLDQYVSNPNTATVDIYTENIYGIPPGTHALVAVLQQIIAAGVPADMLPGTDVLLQKILTQLEEYSVILEAVHDASDEKQRCIFENGWNVSETGELLIWLNGREPHKFGYYTLDAIRLWLEDSPNSPTLREKPVKAGGGHNTHRENMSAAFERVVQAGLTADSVGERLMYCRLLRVLVTKCVLADLRTEFTGALLPE